MIAESLIKALKFLAIIVVCSVFMVAINAFLAYISSVVITGVVGEILYIISACMPFDALIVFGALLTACNAILAFLIAKKIFDLTSWGISTV